MRIRAFHYFRLSLNILIILVPSSPPSNTLDFLIMSVLFAAFLAFAKFIFSIIKDDFMQVKLLVSR